MGRRLRTAYGFLQLLSIDVILGALLSGMMVARLLELHMPHYWYWVLPLSVWVIYTTDHLIDAHRLKANAHTPRHLFHYRYFRQIGLVWGLGIAICTLYVPFIVGEDVLYFGFAMGALVLGHLTLVWLIGDRIAWFIHKELGVGLIYAAGVWGAPLVLYGSPIADWIICAAAQFFLLALLNLLIFSFYERETDTLDQHTSFVRALGEKPTRYLLILLSGLILSLGLYGGLKSAPLPYYAVLQIIYALMLTILLWVFFDEKRFRVAERYRLWGDAVFLFPALSLLL